MKRYHREVLKLNTYSYERKKIYEEINFVTILKLFYCKNFQLCIFGIGLDL